MKERKVYLSNNMDIHSVLLELLMNNKAEKEEIIKIISYIQELESKIYGYTE